MNKIAIMGFGNPVRSDDAIGIYVIEQLQKTFKSNPEISIFDMGTSAFEVLFGLKGHNHIILIDAVINSKEPIGTVFKLPAEEVMKAPENDPMVFLHGMKWNQALSYAKKILNEEYPKNIEVYLIAIENTALEESLDYKVKKAGDKVIKIISNDLNNILKNT